MRYKKDDKVFIHKLKTSGIVINVLDLEDEDGLDQLLMVEYEKHHDKHTYLTQNQFTSHEVSHYSPKNKRNNDNKKDTILFAKTHPDAVIPGKNQEDAGYDIYPCFEEDKITIEPNGVKMIPTGIASSVLSKYVLVAKERGSTGKRGLSVRAGIVDSGYRGEIFIPINNTTYKPIVISKMVDEVQDDGVVYYPYKNAIAQLLLLPVPDVNVKEIPYDELKQIPSKRGLGKLGSSGK